MSDYVPKFWLEDPSALFNSMAFFPNENMTRDQKLNALTRLAILISGGLYWLQYPYWLTFLLVSVLGIVALKYSCKPERKEGFSIPPTYQGINHEETVLAPTFAEEWQIPPPEYDLVDEIYDENTPEGLSDAYGPRNAWGEYEADDGQRYVKLADMRRNKDPTEVDPYGQYLTRTNQLPGDHDYMKGRGSLSTARAFANDAFQRHRTAHQEDMTRIIKKKIARRFSNNLYTVSSAFTSEN